MIEFGTGGFRGVIGDDFNKANVQVIAQALSDVAKESVPVKPIAVGYDNRFMSDYAAKWIVEVLNGNGIKAFLTSSSVPTPLVMMITRDKDLDYGVMVTASHNPYVFNGVKVFQKGGIDADVAFTSMLEKRIQNVKDVNSLSEIEAKEKDLIEVIDYIPDYVSCIESFLSKKAYHSPLKVLFNNMYGVAFRSLLPLAKDLDLANFKAINTSHDAFFGFHDPNPAKENIMGEFTKQVVDGHYDFGIATDSDADRLGVIDEKGGYVDANEIMACLYYYLVKYRLKKGDVVKNIATSSLLDGIATSLGYKCHVVDVGFKNISAGIKTYDALLGGESSGGLTVRGYLFGKDSSFSAALFMEMVSVLGKPVSAIVSEVKQAARYHHVFIEDSYAFHASPVSMMEYINKHQPEFHVPCLSSERIGNNYKYDFGDGCFLLIRLSGTEPKFRIFAEMEDEEDSSKAIEVLKDYLNRADQACR